jgi:hypothetical protein
MDIKRLGAASAWAAEKFGGLCRLRQTQVTLVGGTVGTILAADPERVMWKVFNLSVNNVFGGFTESVSSSNGFVIAAGGGAAGMNLRDDANGTIMPVFGFCPANVTLTVVEVRRETSI